MKQIYLLLALISCYLTVSAQVTFDKGYIIDNSGRKTVRFREQG